MEEGQQAPSPESTWAYKPNDQAPATSQPKVTTSSHPAEVSWSASEYIAHQKSSGWYMLLGFGSVAAAAAVLLLTNDKISATMIVIVALMFGIFAARQPRVLNYQVGHSGIRIGEKFYSYGDFKSFSIIEEGPIDSILLIPMKRFMPGVSMYYPPEEENKIMDVIVQYLPHEERNPDPIDNLMRKMRF